MNRTEDYFDGQFAQYDENRGNAWGMNWRAYMVLRADAIQSAFEKIANKKERPSILEIGCASGDFTARCLPTIKKRRGYIHGVDLAQKAVDICRERFAGVEECSFSNGKLPELNTGRKYDIILCMDVMEYFDIGERDACYKNMAGLLDDGGVLLLQMPLAGENAVQVREQLEKFYEIRKTEYVFGQLWYELFENRLCWAVDALYFRKRGIPFDWFGKMAYRLMKHKKLVGIFFRINKRIFPRKRSHIVMVCTKKGQGR